MPSIAITVVQGDITDSSCDAIVNAANNHLWMGSGVAGAIKRRGGTIIEQEAMAQGPINPGEAVATTAGDLKAKHVIHAAGMGQDLATSAELIRKSTEASLRIADSLSLESIAFPAIGTGVGGFDAADCARIMISVVNGYTPITLQSVEFVLFDAKSAASFRSVLTEFD
jgi:O-acetyl-ADP-ribose deacetylase (regulator of RNase III)